MTKLARRLRAAREDMGLSGIDLAKRVGVTAASIYYWETDHCVPRAANLTALCKALRLPVRGDAGTGGARAMTAKVRPTLDTHTLGEVRADLYAHATPAALESDRFVQDHAREVIEATYPKTGERSRFIVAEHMNVGPGWAMYDINTAHPYRITTDLHLRDMVATGELADRSGS